MTFLFHQVAEVEDFCAGKYGVGVRCISAGSHCPGLPPSFRPTLGA